MIIRKCGKFALRLEFASGTERKSADVLIRGMKLNSCGLAKVERLGYATMLAFTSQAKRDAAIQSIGLPVGKDYWESDTYQLSQYLTNAGHILIRQQFGLKLSGKGGSRYGLDGIDSEHETDSVSFFESANVHTENHSIHGGWIAPVKEATTAELKKIRESGIKLDLSDPFNCIRAIRAIPADAHISPIVQGALWARGKGYIPIEHAKKSTNELDFIKWVATQLSTVRRAKGIEKRESLLYRARHRALKARRKFEELRDVLAECKRVEPNWEPTREFYLELGLARDMAVVRAKVVRKLEFRAMDATRNDIKMAMHELAPDKVKLKGRKKSDLVPLTPAQKMAIKRAKAKGIELAVERHKRDTAHLDAYKGEMTAQDAQRFLSDLYESAIESKAGNVTQPVRLGA